MMDKKKIAVYGGSFNPPTMSHYQIMKMLIDEIKVDGDPIDEVWMIPCGNRPDKKISTPGQKRLQLCEIGMQEVFGDDPRYKVNPIEIDNGMFIPTYRLLNILEDKHPELDIYFVLGSDLLPSFSKWDHGEDMIEQKKFIIIPREGFEDIEEEKYPRHYVKCNHKVEDVFATSSTEVRNILQWNNIVHHKPYLQKKLGSNVYDYIIENNLFA